MKIHMQLAACFCGLLLSIGAQSQTFPKMKAGLWESKTTSAMRGNQEHTSSMCIDDAVQKEMMQMSQGMQQQMCTKNEFSTSGNTVIGNSECRMGPSVIRTKSTTTFSGDSAYHTESSTQFDPPMMGMKDSKTTVDARYIGPCKPGMKAGDVTTGGSTINVLEMTKAMRGAKP